MGCHSVRVNLYGSSNEKIWLENSIRNLNKLCEYAKDFNINIIIENHNSLSSNADLLLKVIKNIDNSKVILLIFHDGSKFSFFGFRT